MRDLLCIMDALNDQGMLWRKHICITDIIGHVRICTNKVITLDFRVLGALVKQADFTPKDLLWNRIVILFMVYNPGCVTCQLSAVSSSQTF